VRLVCCSPGIVPQARESSAVSDMCSYSTKCLETAGALQIFHSLLKINTADFVCANHSSWSG